MIRHTPRRSAAGLAGPSASINRPPLALVRDEPSAREPDAIVNAAKIDPTILGCPAYHDAATGLPGPTYAIGPVIGRFERFNDFAGDQRVVYRYMDEQRDAYVGAYPDFGGDPDIEADLFRVIQRMKARCDEIRATKQRGS